MEIAPRPRRPITVDSIIALEIARMFNHANFVTFKEMEAKTGLSTETFIQYKDIVEAKLRKEETSIRLISQYHCTHCGWFLDC